MKGEKWKQREGHRRARERRSARRGEEEGHGRFEKESSVRKMKHRNGRKWGGRSKVKEGN